MNARRRLLAICLTLVSAGVLLTACGKAPEARQFVGTWKSSRITTPIVLMDNGEWEIRDAEGAVLQFGLWRVDGQSLVWTIRNLDERLTDDANTIVSAEPRRFVLRERDGSMTTFDRQD